MFAKEFVLDRSETSLPLYIQIADGILDRIESGELTPGETLPSERELSGKLGVNRLTLRRAFRILEDQGWLARRQGSGTTIMDGKIEWQAGRLIPFTQGVRVRGYVPGAQIILFEQRGVETGAASELDLAVLAAVYYVHRLRLINREPVMLERFTLPAHRFPGFEQHDLVHRSLYEIMETEYGVSVNRARQSLEPVVATAYEAKLLHIRPGSPLMLEHRLTVDGEGRPVELGKDLYRGDRFRFVTEIAPLERQVPYDPSVFRSDKEIDVNL